MTVREAVREGSALLEGSGSESPFLDASLLLGRAMGLEPSRLLAAYPESLDGGALAAFRASLSRRASGEPVAYILGRKEFRGLDFAVDRRVLIPRPETEHLVEAALDAARVLVQERPDARRLRLHDACTGSGCVGISLARELAESWPRLDWEVSLSDISGGALEVASANALRLAPPGRAAARAFRSDLLGGLEGPFDIITANPPYLTDNEMDEARASGRGEPELALSGGPDGLDPYRRLLPRAGALLAHGGFLIVEIGWRQREELESLFRLSGYGAVKSRTDLAGRDRIVCGRSGWKIS